VLPTSAELSPGVDYAGVTFLLADPYYQLRSVRLVEELGIPGPLLFTHERSRWRLRIPLPAVDRMEYLFEIEDRHGNRTTIVDPANPARVGGAFGDKSEVRFAGYEEPSWLEWPVQPASVEPIDIAAPTLADTVAGVLWVPETLDAKTPAPLLVVHDGPEYTRLGSFTHYLGASIDAGLVPPLRAVLLAPRDRDAWYAANPAYADLVCNTLLPALEDIAPATVRIGVGVSLGALAMLHAHRRCPTAFDGLFLQSGSFFTPHLDPQESNFSGFAAVTSFVADVETAAADARPVPTVITCGAAEENLANNRRMAATLARLGYDVEMLEFRDAHNYVAWRDSLDPHLTKLIARLAGAHAT
jgi:enterochelin esterase-like enzyme